MNWLTIVIVLGVLALFAFFWTSSSDYELRQQLYKLMNDYYREAKRLNAISPNSPEVVHFNSRAQGIRDAMVLIWPWSGRLGL